MARRQHTQYLALKKRSEQTQNALDHTHSALEAIEDELASFLETYYTHVGADFEQLSALQAELQRVANQSLNLSGITTKDTTSHSQQVSGKHALKRDMQGLYHHLAREVHPDTNAMKDELMASLNAAYARKSLSEMWKIKWDLEQRKAQGQLSHKQRLELLQSQQEHMQRALEDLQSREQDIKQSEAYQLMRHAELMRVCGQDFMAMVKGRVQTQIAETKQQLVSARIRQKYWQHVKSEPANRNKKLRRESA